MKKTTDPKKTTVPSPPEDNSTSQNAVKKSLQPAPGSRVVKLNNSSSNTAPETAAQSLKKENTIGRESLSGGTDKNSKVTKRK